MTKRTKFPVFQWRRNGAWRTGTYAVTTDGLEIDRELPNNQSEWLMQLSCAGGLEWVKPSELSRYPSSPIPEPEH
jgi:hypothetical protein